MPLVSAVSVPADDSAENEDAFALGAGVGVVVDGAGIPAEFRAGCSHTVAWYAHALAGTFRDNLEHRGWDMRQALAESIAAVTASHRVSCRLEDGSPSATVAAWRLTPDAVEYLVLCDASIIVSHVDGTVAEITDDRISRVIASLAGDRAARREAVERNRNRAGGFWCCQTDPSAASEAICGRLGRGAVRAVIAASDGATRGYQLLRAHTVDGLADSVLAGDSAAVIDAIREAERGDETLLSRVIKQHDDATLVALLLD